MEKTGPQNLNQRQLKFVELYAGGYSATEAYMQAYDLPEERRQYAGTSASRLLKNPKVHNLVVEIQKQVFDSLCLNAEKVAIKLAEMGFAEKNDEYYTPQIQLKALDLLQKQMGLQTKNIKTDTDNTTVISVNIEKEG